MGTHGSHVGKTRALCRPSSRGQGDKGQLLLPHVTRAGAVRQLSYARRRSGVRVPGVRAGGPSANIRPASGLPSLDAASLWRLRFDLFSGKAEGDRAAGNGPDRTVSVTVQFVVDEGYEPPQGALRVITDESGMFSEGGLNRWTLEEDPSERKAGLWIWGLFEEPLYPFMLLSMDINRLEVAEGGYHIPQGKLFAEIKHARGSKSGHVLTDGVLNFKVTKTYQADLVGLSKVSVGEPTMCGKLRADCIEVTAQ
eukprot:CAMPEP_0181357012 /NCGR_PEP_ID=MMETSP1106-20121128/4725_1 /TAXON_ID=81844 /ORGANISM="Mantoniella antarctica, Strain SL-175" /LENGTH=252 /DNA_ID=CAMNT_0023469829 /DNA_START=100 /DNA_END=858 /DNA_ORIENTATION=+